MNPCLLIFLLLLAAHQGVALYLALVQVRHLRRRKDRVPAHLVGKVDIETVRRAVAYQLDRLRLGVASRLAALVPLGVLLAGGFGWLDTFSRTVFDGPVLSSILLIGLVAAIGALWELPWRAVAVFRVEASHGFNRQTPARFVMDVLKELLVTTVLGGALVSGLLAIMNAVQQWWVPVAMVTVAFQLAMVWLLPTFILPLFNRFEAVDEGIGHAVGALARQSGFPVRDVVKMDGSRRSAHSNAFIVGLWGARRIVLFDTLLEQLSVDGVVAVVAHELGHFKLRHIQRRLVVGLAGTVFALWLLFQLSQDAHLFAGFGFAQGSLSAILIVGALFAEELGFFLGAGSRFFSRKDELAADRFAARATGEGRHLADALVVLSKKNLSSPGSHPHYRAWYNSHPSLRERLAALGQI